MIGKVIAKAAIIMGHWATLYLGYKAGLSAAKHNAELSALKRENEELKTQLNSKTGG